MKERKKEVLRRPERTYHNDQSLEEPGGLQTTGLQKRHNLANKHEWTVAATAA